jgi:Domain of unknown function (DUF4114)
MKQISKKTLVLGTCALFAFSSPLWADDGNSGDSSKNNENQQSGQSSENGDGKGGGSSGGTVSPVQAKADPYGLKKAGQVMEAGSTSASKSFDATELPAAVQFVHQNLPEGQNNTGSKAFMIDPSKIVLQSQTAVTATFVNEGAGYHNSIGVDVVQAGDSQPKSWWDEVTAPTSKLIFPDASSTVGFDAAGKAGTRTASEPLLPGDFVNLGTYKAGTALDFFLIANGANGGGTVVSANSSLNNDGFNKHVAAFVVPNANSPYVFLSFEDLWGGGDKDINDVIVAVNVGAKNVKALLATPEPRMWLTLGSFLVFAVWAKRRMDKQAAVAQA